MEKRRKRIAVFGCSLTSRYRKYLCRAMNIAAEELDVDLVIFNNYGRIEIKNRQSVDYESELLEYIDLEQFDGIIFDGEGYAVDGVSDKVERKLHGAKCPVVSISSHVDGFYNIEFDDAGGLRAMVEHFINVHHFTRIGFMSGYLTHADAQVRLAEFRAVMKEHGMPQDGVGMFEGDFWYNKGGEAANFFLSLSEWPEAIVCANDYMAISLINALRKRGVRVPEDIAVSGYDGTIEGREFLPHMTSVTRERIDIAKKALKLLVNLAETGEADLNDLKVYPKPIYAQSCGCEPLDYHHVLETVARVHEEKRVMSTALFEAEVAMLKLDKVNSVRAMETVFMENAVNFGEYSSFFLMVHTDAKGVPAYESSFTSPSGNFVPVIWVDKNKEYEKSTHRFSSTSLIPESSSDRCHVYYVMCAQCADKVYGYSVVEMTGKDIFDEFHNVWLHNLSMTLNTLYKNDHINKLIGKLENLSVKDELTGLLNRRGFDDRSRNTIAELNEPMTVCTIVIDMDGLKRINDEIGHHEGDRAIKALADAIKRSCEYGEIAGRAGGDEFYIFAPDHSENRLKRFVERMKACIAEYNSSNRRGYQLDFSYGAYITETDSCGRIEDFLKISDSRMYEQKMTKPGRRR